MRATTSVSGTAGLLNLPVAGVAIVLVLAAGSAEAAGMAYSPGFWSGFGDGFLALLKLLVSPLYDVTLVDTRADAGLYDAGYYLGVLLFAAFAGLAASPAQPEVPAVTENRAEPRVSGPIVG